MVGRMNQIHRATLGMIVVGLVSLISLAKAQTTTNPAPQFRAGAAAANITPWMGISINGNMTDHKGTNVHDQLHARAIVLDDGQTRLAIVVADSCMIYREIFDAAKKLIHERTGMPTENILMSATHTHSAPASVSIFQSEADKEYQKFLTLRLADAVQQAIANLAPAQIGWGVGSEPRHVFNRRWRMKPGVVIKDVWGNTNDLVKMNPLPGRAELLEPAGPVDPEVPVLAVRALDGKPIAVLANYSMHYCGAPGRTYSADYFGAFCDRIRQLLGADRQDPPFVAVMSNGTSGDCNSTNFREPYQAEPPFEKVRMVATHLAEDALEVYRKIAWRDGVKLRAAQKEIVLGVRKARPDELARAKELLAKAKARTDGQFGGWGPEVYSREAVLLDAFPNQMPLIIQTFKIGELGIAAIPCEVFAEIGLEIKKRSPLKPSFTIELANGYNGYLPTPAQHQLGGYETWRARSSYLEVDASLKVVATLMELFGGLKLD